MNAGSKRITIRVGDELLEQVKAAVKRRNDLGGKVDEWKVTDFVIQAILDKLNHSNRSRKVREKAVQVDKPENAPREFDFEVMLD